MGMLAARPSRHEPYIFTGQEIAALLAAAGQHRWHLPAVTYPALFGLIAVPGASTAAIRSALMTPTRTWRRR